MTHALIVKDGSNVNNTEMAWDGRSAIHTVYEVALSLL